MCADALAGRWPAEPASVNRAAIRRVVITGTIVGVVGAVSFATVHALVILPIWRRIPGGLLQSIPIGVAFASAFDHLARARGWYTAAHGASLGAVMFLTLLPGTAFANALRLAGLPAGDWPATIAALAIAGGSGWSAGWTLTRERHAARAIAIATLVLTAGAGGPIPVVNSLRATWLFVGFIPICAVAGTAAALTRRIVGEDIS
jgi:hypothetical protein